MEFIRRMISPRPLFCGLILLLMLWSCRQEDEISPITIEQGGQKEHLKVVGSFYLLNEGSMGSNKATLDYYDYATGNYMRNLFAMRNPQVNKELGDVGNDLALYGSKLWAVINNSQLIEVMDASTAKHLGAVQIINGRYLAFKGSYAYVSSYAGEIKLDPNARLGYVAKIDTATLSEVRRCDVGYQPEEMAIIGDKLYVACSGGYRVPQYDNRISVIDLGTFELERHIDVAINLHRLKADAQGYLWVSSRGDYGDIPSRLYVVDPKTGKTVKSFDIACSSMVLDGDMLYGYGQSYKGSKAGATNYFVINTRTRELISERLVSDDLKQKIKTPYGIAINPETKDILICDAGGFTTPGTLYSIDKKGTFKWSVTTGNIPNKVVFLPKAMTLPYSELKKLNQSAKRWKDGENPYITKVLEYRPAPGQWVNKLPQYQEGDTEEEMKAKVLESIGNNKRKYITLGAWGGYVVVGFDHTIRNEAGKRDFRVLGNTAATYAEPGIIYVAYDKNKNGKPDTDEWYEIAGSAVAEYQSIPWLSAQRARGKDVALYRDYALTYHRPPSEGKPESYLANYIRWVSNKGTSAYLQKNPYHDQSYYPMWIKDEHYTLYGTRLPQNAYNSKPEKEPEGLYILQNFAYGYADNVPNEDLASTIDIDWAIDKAGRKVKLPGVDFIKIQTGVLQDNGWIGECSTEFMGIEDLHLLTK